MKKIIKFMLIAVMLTGFTTSLNANTDNNISEANTVYKESGQFSLENITMINSTELDAEISFKEKVRKTQINEISIQEFLNENPEIKEEVENNLKKGLELKEIAYTKVCLKEVSNGKGGYDYVPMTVTEYNAAKKARTTYNNLTTTIQYYADSWNRGKATVNQQAVWSDVGGSTGADNSTDDFMALTVAKNHSILTHGMSGVASNFAASKREENGVAYRFKENKGSQILTTNTSFRSYNAQRLFVGMYVHTWAAANVSFGFGLTGPTVTIGSTTATWNITCELVKYSDWSKYEIIK